MTNTSPGCITVSAQAGEFLHGALGAGGVQVYTTALECVVNDDLKEEWQEYLEQTKNHERVVRNQASMRPACSPATRYSISFGTPDPLRRRP